jgi:hypothetical protein
MKPRTHGFWYAGHSKHEGLEHRVYARTGEVEVCVADCDQHVPLSEAAQNARLISAAPDLALFADHYINAFESHRITNASSSELDYTGFLAGLALKAMSKVRGEA